MTGGLDSGGWAGDLGPEMALIWVHVQLRNLRLVLHLLEHPLWMGSGCVS